MAVAVMSQEEGREETGGELAGASKEEIERVTYLTQLAHQIAQTANTSGARSFGVLQAHLEH